MKILVIMFVISFAVMLGVSVISVPARAQGQLTPMPVGPTATVVQTYPTAPPITPQAVTDVPLQPKPTRIAVQKQQKAQLTPMPPGPTATVIQTNPTAQPVTPVVVTVPPQEPKPVVPEAPRAVEPSLITIFTLLIGVLVGAFAGGGTVLVVYGRAIKSILNSPVIMKSFEELAKSWPAPVREAVADTGRFLEGVADDVPSVAALKPAEPAVG